MRSRAFIGTALLLLGLLAPNAPAEADPIVITSGTIVQPGGPGLNIGNGSLVGTQNFTWPGQTDPFASFGSQCELRCSPGATVDIGGFLGASNVKGEVTYQDQRFLVGGTPASFGVLNMDFTIDSFVLPPAGSSAAFSSAFTMSGELIFPFFGPPAQPNVPLSGSGIATAFFVASPSAPGVAPGWQLSQFTYNFDSEPVPEPTTMLLVGGGLVALMGRRLRSRHGND
jgi:hypothetical protein